jgi:hypothetical protein
LNIPHPTDAELAILRRLCQEWPGAARHVHDVPQNDKELGCASVLKTLQIMTENSLAVRGAFKLGRACPPPEAQRRAPRSLVDYVDYISGLRTYKGASPC